MRNSKFCAIAAFLLLGCSGTPEGDPPVETSAHPVRETGYVDVHAGRLYYETAGVGDNVLLIHGNTGDRRHWDFQFETLAAHFRVTRYDVRGYGLSSVPVEAEPYTDFDDLSDLLDSLGIDRAHVVGWSMGSGIAIDFALAHPEKVLSLIPVGPWINGYSSPGAMEMFEGMGQVVTAMAEGGREAATDALMNASFLQKTMQDSAATELFRRVAAEYSYWGFANPSPQLGLQPGALERLADIQAPTLVLVGEHDVVACMEIADLLDEAVPDSRKVVVGGTGHMMQLEKPNEVSQSILDFLSDTEAPARQPAQEKAIVWFLGHSGWAIRIQNSLFVFDYQKNYGSGSEENPRAHGLFDGFVNPEEIADLDVYVFVTHQHLDHFDSVIFDWQADLTSLTYFFGWADEPTSHCESFVSAPAVCHTMAGPRARIDLEQVTISTINSHHSRVPEVAYLVRFGDWVLYHNGDYKANYTADFEYLHSIEESIDVAFLGAEPDTLDQYFRQAVLMAEKFEVSTLFAMHFGDEPERCVRFASQLADVGVAANIECPQSPGEQFVFSR